MVNYVMIEEKEEMILMKVKKMMMRSLLFSST